MVGLAVSPFVPQAGILGGAFALIALLAPRVFPRVTSQLLNGSAEANPNSVNTSANPVVSAPRKTFLSIGVLRLFAWSLLWICPIAVWTWAFFFLERKALSGSASRLFAADIEILLTMGAVFIAWLVISIFWFRQKHGDGLFLFSSPVRRKGILATAGLAAIFCACGYGTWYSDVLWLGMERVATGNPNYPMPIAVARQQFNVLIEFEDARDGISVIIESDNGRTAWTPNGKTLRSIFSGSVGTVPWRAVLGQTTFASGDVTFEQGKMAVINVPRPKLIDLIDGRWKSQPAVAAMGPGSGEASDKANVEFEFNKGTGIIAHRSAGQTSRNDLTIQIDESVSPALISLTQIGGEKLVGIIRFEPHAVQPELASGGMGMSSDLGMMGGMGMGGEMMGGTESGSHVPTKDRLFICISQGGFLRPWKFEADRDHGIELFELTRSDDPEPLRRSLVLEPLPSGTTAEVVKESVEAWSQRLKVPIERRNSIGMDLTLVPPACVDLPPGNALRDQRLLLPASQKIVNQNAATGAGEMGGDSGGMTSGDALKPMVSYPFVMSRDVISIGQFQQFVTETGYVTDAERGEPLTRTNRPSETSGSTESATATQSAAPVEETAFTTSMTETSIGGWQREDGKFVWQDGLSWKTTTLDSAVTAGDVALKGEAKMDVAATVLSLHDATEFCKWLTTKENRQYRLPTAQEWTVAIQLGAVRAPSETEGAEHFEYRRWFDAQKPNPLGIKTTKQIFGEWTAETEWMMNEAAHLIVKKDLSSDELRFDLSHQAVALPAFRASGLSFRVVAELQALTTPDNHAP